MLRAPVAGARRAAPADTLLYALVLALAVSLPFEPIRPLLSLGWLDVNHLKLLLAASAVVWVLSLTQQPRRAAGWRAAAPALAFLAIATISAASSPFDRGQALKFLARLAQPVLLLHGISEAVETWYRADYLTPTDLTAHPGETATVPVRLSNTGDRIWLASGVHPFALSYHVAQPDGTSVNYDGLRTPLPADVPPGGSVSLEARLVAPETPGSYVIEWDGVQEAVTWFSWAGTPAGRTYLTVAGQAATGTEAPGRQTSAPPDVTPPPGRLTQWGIALRMLRNRPLFGVGPDNFRWVYGDFAGTPTWDTGDHANSLYFEWLADIGVVGLATYLWFAWRLLWCSARSLGTARSPDSRWVWRLAFVASLAVWFLHSAMDYFYEPLPTNAAFWLIAALALAAAETDHARSGTTGCVSPST